VKIHPLFFITFLALLNALVFGQEHERNLSEYSQLKKRVYSFSKLDFITSEGEFNESICTLLIPDLKEDSPPFVAIYYKRDNSEWFTESLYRKRLRFNFKDGILKLDQSNFWDWFEIAEIKIVVIY
tara:strand:- start:620 stop:997 length:378 start_codon:yes stop_codon:yes gene_type:complete